MCRRRTTDKQAFRNRTESALRKSGLFRRHVQRLYLIDQLSLGAQGFAAGRENLNSRARLQHHLDHNRRRVDDMLATIEHDQHLLIREELDHAPKGILRGAWSAQYRSKRRRQK